MSQVELLNQSSFRVDFGKIDGSADNAVERGLYHCWLEAYIINEESPAMVEMMRTFHYDFLLDSEDQICIMKVLGKNSQ